MTTFNNQDLQSKFDHNGYIAINPLFSIDILSIENNGFIAI